MAPGYRGHPRRSDLVRAERENPVEVRVRPGKPTVREAQLLCGGNGWSRAGAGGNLDDELDAMAQAVVWPWGGPLRVQDR